MKHQSPRALAALLSIPTYGQEFTYDFWLWVLDAARSAGLGPEDFKAWTGPYALKNPPEKGNWDIDHHWSSGRSVKVDTLFSIAETHGRQVDAEPWEVWDRCVEAPESHPYFNGKKSMFSDLAKNLRMLPHDDNTVLGGRSMAGALVVPMHDECGALVNLEVIHQLHDSKDGTQNAAMYREVSRFVLGELKQTPTVYVCKTLADAWVCWRTTGAPAVLVHESQGENTSIPCLASLNPSAELVKVCCESPGRWLNDWRQHKDTLGVFDAWYPSSDLAEMGSKKGFDYVGDILDSKMTNGARKESQALHLAASRAASESASRGSRAWQKIYDEYLEDNSPENEDVDQSSPYVLIGGDDLAARPALAWRIGGVLPSAGVVGLYGASGSGKSFLGLDMGAAIASGDRWFGLPVEAAPVVAVVLENEAGFPKRIAAWEAQHMRKLPSDFQLIMQPFKLTASADVAALAAAIPRGAVVIIDTLNRAAPTSDENSSRDMGTILEAAKTLQALTAGLVVLVHHTGKDVSKGPRGHSSFYAALDAAILVTQEGGKREWRVHKAKDDKDGDRFPFHLDTVALGISENGEPITSCVVGAKGAARSTPKSEPIPRTARIALDALRFALEKQGQTPPGNVIERFPDSPPVKAITEIDWRLAAVQAGLTESDATPASKRKAFTRAKSPLIDSGSVLTFDGWVWTV